MENKQLEEQVEMQKEVQENVDNYNKFVMMMNKMNENKWDKLSLAERETIIAICEIALQDYKEEIDNYKENGLVEDE